MTFEEQFPELADPNGDIELECKLNPIAAMLLNVYLERRENSIYKNDVREAIGRCFSKCLSSCKPGVNYQTGCSVCNLKKELGL